MKWIYALFNIKHVHCYSEKNRVGIMVCHTCGKESEQRTWCFCPSCKEDLCSNNSLVEDTDLVRYQCSNCGNKSEWNFDIAPVALVVRSDNGYTDFKV